MCMELFAVEIECRAEFVCMCIHIVLCFILLAAEIEHISGLFQEKQAELQAAVLRVDQLSQQLEELRRGRLNGLQGLGGHVTGTAALELRKLYQELQVCTDIHPCEIYRPMSKLQYQKFRIAFQIKSFFNVNVIGAVTDMK